MASFSRLGDAPGIKLTWLIVRGEESPITKFYEREHKGSLLWQFKPVFDHVEKKFRDCIRPDSFMMQWSEGDLEKDVAPNLLMNFTSDFVIAQNMTGPDNIRPLQKEEQDVLDLINTLFSTPRQQIVLRLHPYAKEMEKIKEAKSGEPELKTMSTLLPTGSSTSAAFARGAMFEAYRSTSMKAGGKPNVQFGSMLSRMNIIMAGAPFLAHGRATRFIDADHAQISLAYGQHLEHLEMKQVITAISNDEHVCTMYKIPHGVLVAVKYQSLPYAGLGSERFSVPANTAIKISVKSNKSKDDEFEATGITIDQEIDVSPPADVQILFTGKQTRQFSFLAKRDLKPSHPERFVVKLEHHVRDSVIKEQIDTIRKMCNIEAIGGSAGYWLVLMLYAGNAANSSSNPASNPWAELAENEEAGEAFDNLSQATPRTAGQKAALEATKNMLHRTTLVTGPGGSGKTTIMVEKGMAVLSQNSDGKPTAKMLYISERNLACDNVLHKLLKKDPNLFVVRAYAQQKTVYEVDDTNDAEKLRDPGMSNEALALLDQVEDKIPEMKSKRYAEARCSAGGRTRSPFTKNSPSTRSVKMTRPERLAAKQDALWSPCS